MSVRPSRRRTRRPVQAVALLLAGATSSLGLARHALAQAAAATALPTGSIVVTGNPLGRDNLAEASSVLAGDGLLLRRGSSLGATLDGLPGTASGGFAPQASRPVIRGLDGDRVRLLDNGAAMVDASNLSFDHAVAADPLVAERIELLRGPAALLYGGNAVGGVVNTLDNRIPRSPAAGLAARTEWRLGGASDERSAVAVLDGGAGAGLAWHVDAFARRQGDQRSPRHAPQADGETLDATTRVRNSAATAQGGALGLGWVGTDGHLGVSLDSLQHDYGVTVEPDVQVQLRRQRLALSGERRRLPGWFDQVSVDVSSTRYRHQELEGTEVGTTFSSRGHELRVQARHVPLDAGPAAVRGVLGLQATQLAFQALGDEAFVPGTRTRTQALFVLEEAELGALRLQLGARHEQVRVASDGDAGADPAGDAAEARFGAARQRRFSPGSVSLGATWRLAPGWALGTTLGRTERAPAYYELFANGVHVATAAYERGDDTLGVERSRHAAATLAWHSGPHSLKASAWLTRFDRYIALVASGDRVDTGDGDRVPEYRFQALPARLRGLELEGRWRLLDAAAMQPWRVDLTAVADTLRAHDTRSGQPLPRLAPARASLALDARHGPVSLGLGLKAVARAARVPDGDTPTAGHVLWGAWASWRQAWAGAEATWFVRADNLGNRLAYSATAVATVRGLSPLPGRAVTAGLRVQL